MHQSAVTYYVQKVEFNRIWLYGVMVGFLASLLVIFFVPNVLDFVKTLLAFTSAAFFLLVIKKNGRTYKEIKLNFSDTEITSKDEDGDLDSIKYEKLELVYMNQFNRLILGFGGGQLEFIESKINSIRGGISVFDVMELLNKKCCYGDNDIFKTKSLIGANVSKKQYSLSIFLAIALCVIYLLQQAAQQVYSISLIELMGNNRNLVENGDYYRLLTSVVIHGGFLHIAFNAINIFILGRKLEILIGSKNLFLLSFLSVVTGSLLSMMMLQEHSISIGASTIVYGYIGALISLKLFSPKYLPSTYGLPLSLLPALLAMEIWTFYYMSLYKIDWAGHVGGFLGGFFFLFMYSRYFNFLGNLIKSNK